MLATCMIVASCKRGAPGTVEAAPDAALTFVHDGRTVRRLSLAELSKAVSTEEVRAFDPYYGRQKRFRALSLAKVIAVGFAGEHAEFEKEDFVLRAKDGYAVPLSGALLMERGGYVAFQDLDVPGWEPIGPQQANPGPFYVVWSEKDQTSLDSHPRPWQLVSIEIAPFEKSYPHVFPTGAEGAAVEGFAVFKAHCFKCHAVNQEGGHVGPDLNVPQSIVEYRPEPQIRAYIRNPATFRYGSMPPHPLLSERELDALIAYFRAMKERKHDPHIEK